MHEKVPETDVRETNVHGASFKTNRGTTWGSLSILPSLATRPITINTACENLLQLTLWKPEPSLHL